jgi:hypothetical protein
MTPRTAIRVIWLCITLLSLAAQSARANGYGCDETASRGIPVRPSGAPGGQEFGRRAQGLSGVVRDTLVRAELLSGNVPAFLRHLTPVQLLGPGSSRDVEVTVCVLPDYLAVGTDSDFVIVPMGLKAALDVAHHFGFELPTPKLVDAIYAEAQIKLQPQPLPAGASMRSTAYVLYHNELINEQRSALDAPLGALTAGEKKDLVLTSRLWRFPGRLAIYGWHRAENQPIQPLSTVHGAGYADYSHGVRLISATAYVNGLARPLAEILGEPGLAQILSYDGPLPRLSERLQWLIDRL